MKKLIFLAGAAVGMFLASFSYELMPPACAAEAAKYSYFSDKLVEIMEAAMKEDNNG